MSIYHHIVTPTGCYVISQSYNIYILIIKARLRPIRLLFFWHYHLFYLVCQINLTKYLDLSRLLWHVLEIYSFFLIFALKPCLLSFIDSSQGQVNPNTTQTASSRFFILLFGSSYFWEHTLRKRIWYNFYLYLEFLGSLHCSVFYFIDAVNVCVCVWAGLHYGKESVRSSGGADLHNFISSGFVTLGRGHPKGKDPSLSLSLSRPHMRE